MLKPVLVVAALLFACGGPSATATSPPAYKEMPADIALKPPGSGWFCTSSGAASRYQPCFRTQADCDAQQARNPSVFSPCQATPTAFCYTELEASGFGELIKGTNRHEGAGWKAHVECSFSGDACANNTRAKDVEHQHRDGPASWNKDISLCTAWD